MKTVGQARTKLLWVVELKGVPSGVTPLVLCQGEEGTGSRVGEGSFRSLGRMEETAGESGAGGPPCHLFQLLPCRSVHSHPQFSFVLDPLEREAARN